jgi:predicted transcriptional regulator
LALLERSVMSAKENRRPTAAELAILQVLWRHGTRTVREVFKELQDSQGTGYTTVLKLMQIMTAKGILKRDEKVRPQIYRVSRTQRQTQRQLLGDLVDRVFSGSPGNLVLQALSSRKTTSEERQLIRQMLDRLEDRQEGAP